MAVGGGRVIAIGADAEALAGRAAEVIEIGDGALLPAFRDGHQHPLLGAAQPDYAPVADATTVQEAVDAVARWAADHPDEEWVRGYGYSPALAERAEMDARWLDAVVPDRPVALRASDFHTMWVNTRALELAGIDASTPDGPHGWVVRRDDGTPMGTLRDWDAWRRVDAVIPRPPVADRVAMARDGLRRLASWGLVAVQDAWVEEDELETWTALLDRSRQEHVPLRVDLATLLEPGSWSQRVRQAAATRDHLAGHGDGWLTARSVKLFADGVTEEGTAALLEPYTSCFHGTGMPRWDDEAELAAAAVAADAAGLQVHVHAIGDAAVRAALNAMAEVVRRNGPRPRRHVVAHSQVLHPDDVGRFAALGVVANVEPLWCQLDTKQTRITVPALGRERADRQFPLESLRRTGARLSCGSDWPVSSAVPMEGVRAAVTRETPDGTPSGGWVPAERLDLTTVLRAYTAGSAYQAFEPDEAALRPGAPADLVLLDADPWAVPASELAGVGVRGTWRGGVRTC